MVYLGRCVIVCLHNAVPCLCPIRSCHGPLQERRFAFGFLRDLTLDLSHLLHRAVRMHHIKHLIFSLQSLPMLISQALTTNLHQNIILARQKLAMTSTNKECKCITLTILFNTFLASIFSCSKSSWV